MKNLLFVCSKNQWRSPTAEKLFRNSSDYAARSAGTSDKARVKLSQKHLEWADIVLVMERRHKQIIEEKYPFFDKEMIVLDIPDEYKQDDPELIDLLKDKLLYIANIMI
jgi:predicted protein tyrosine phosphatase